MATIKTSADKPAQATQTTTGQLPSNASSPAIGNISSPGSRRTSASIITPADFETVTKPKKQAIGLLYGKAKTGKTAFVTLFAPGPIVVINLDGRCDPAIADAVEQGRDVKKAVIEYPTFYMDPPEAKRLALSSMERLFALIEHACQSFRTILLDTGTEIDELFKMGFDGCLGEQTKEGAFGKDKDFINRMWWRIFNIVNKSQAHLIVAAREAEIWVDNKPTGQFKPTISRVPFDACTLIMQISATRNTGIKSVSKVNTEIKVTGSGACRAELGNIYTEADWKDDGPFAYCFWKQFEKSTTIDEWK